MSELKKNRDAYNKIRKELERDHLGKTALLNDGKLIRIFNDWEDAYETGLEQFGHGKFSIRRIENSEVSFGAASGYLKPVPLR